MTEGFGTCPTCGGWAKRAFFDTASRETTYGCAKGHTWTPEAKARVVSQPIPNVHDFELKEAATVYLTGALIPTGATSFCDFVAAADHLRSFRLKVVSVHEQIPIADSLREAHLGMNWYSTAEFRHYLLRDLRAVALADLVALLPDWEESLAVTSVVTFARACGVPVMTIDELLHLLQGENG